MTNQKKKTTGNGEEKSEDIELIDEEIPIEEEKEFNKPATEKKSLNPEEKKQRDGFFSDTINETIKLLINQTYLRDSENKVTTKEIQETQFGQNISKTADYYFPNWNFDNPLWNLGFSVTSLIVLLNNKLPVSIKKEQKKDEEEDNEDFEEDRTTEDDKSPNPYLLTPEKR